ncbi:HD domain-containing protein [Photobacterium sanguinicancri]|uniref:HD domain-containing protein n=1 Tax=Photobacterium sanguinicancri TaxID=875932 RepID=UPI003D0CC3E8
MKVIDFIHQQFIENGHVAYGERISMSEHMMQSAYFAEKKNSTREVVVAAFLHDFGHLILGLPEDITKNGIDGFHEDIGADFLRPYLPSSILDPIQLHVAAKRYLCTVKPGYMAKLSQASKDTLHVQGGTMSDREVHLFEAETYYKDAIQVRLFDDLGKEEALTHPSLDYYLALTEQCLTQAVLISNNNKNAATSLHTDSCSSS